MNAKYSLTAGKPTKNQRSRRQTLSGCEGLSQRRDFKKNAFSSTTRAAATMATDSRKRLGLENEVQR